ncbi:MAG: nucleoside hydrolase [Tepidiformaceae bacterium]
MIRVHLDTDIGGDTDDLCALALLLGSPEVELVGVTTVADTRGGRLSYVRHALELARRESVPAAAGACGFLGPPQQAERRMDATGPASNATRPEPRARRSTCCTPTRSPARRSSRLGRAPTSPCLKRCVPAPFRRAAWW